MNMGILDDTLANFRGDFNATGRGARKADTQYFSGDDFTPGLGDISQEQVPGTGFTQVRSESSSFGSRPAQEPGRDLSQDPLGEYEIKALQGAKTALGILPFGGLMSTAIDYNLGRESGGNLNPKNVNVATPDNMAGRIGFWTGQGNDLTTATQAALARSQLGRLGGMQLPAGLQGAGLLSKFGTEYAGQGFKGLDGVGYDVNAPQFVPGQEVVNDADIVENLPDAPAPEDAPSETYNGGGSSYRPRNDTFGDRGPGGSSGDTAAAAAGANAAGPGYADGGIVGLSGPRYADGGEVGPLLQMGFADGGNVGLAGPGTNQATPQMVDAQVNRMLANPQFRQRIVAGAQQLMQSGELTPQEVQMMGQIAEASMQNPNLYPKLRAFVAQQGMSPLPPAYDPSTIVKILAVTRALSQSGAAQAVPGGPGQTPAGQVPPTDQAQMQNPNGMANGGFLQGPGTGRSDSIGTVNESTGQPVKVANGEYVIPEHVVRAKGRDFFDKMLRQYASVPKQGE